MKKHHIIDAALSFLCLAAMAALVIIQFQWTPENAPTIRKGRIAYGYHQSDSIGHCGNSVINNEEPETSGSSTKQSETCDDGNKLDGDGCSGIACDVESGWTCNNSSLPSVCATICGDGSKKGSEGCDDGNTTAGDGCGATCTVESGYTCNSASPNVCTTSCGDGTKAGSEGCDDGNTTNGDGCSNACAVESGYTCTGQGSGSCTAICGDRVKKTSEGCDDGNTTNGEGCSSSCAVESGYTCTGEPSTCVNKGIGGGGGGGGGGGETLPPPIILPPTPPPPCGNAILEPEKCEECDNGRANGTSACTQKCRLLYCGDGITSTYIKEECEGRIEEERVEDPATKATVSRLWFVTASCGVSCTIPLWTQKKNGTWEHTMGTGCKRDLSLPPCRGTPTERRVQVRPPFSCTVPSGPASSPAPVAPPKPPHCGDGILQTQEGEECDRVLYDKIAVQRIDKKVYGCSSACQITYCGDGTITPFAPLNEECDPEHPTYQSRTCAANGSVPRCTQECRISPLLLCPVSPAPSENIQPLQELEELLQSLETEDVLEEDFEEEDEGIEEEEMLVVEEEKEEEKEEEILPVEEEGEEAIITEGEEEDEEEDASPRHAAAPETGRRIGLFIILLAMGFATIHWQRIRSARRRDR